jgi:hypothetical protein
METKAIIPETSLHTHDGLFFSINLHPQYVIEQWFAEWVVPLPWEQLRNTGTTGGLSWLSYD